MSIAVPREVERDEMSRRYTGDDRARTCALRGTVTIRTVGR